jgi:hemoglobin
LGDQSTGGGTGGGFPVWPPRRSRGHQAVARAFDDRAGKDDRINQKFARTNLERLTKEFVDQLCQDTGGPCTYTGLSMKKSHTNMGVTSGEFDAFMEDLAAVLDDFKVGKAEQEELLNLLRPMRQTSSK